MTSQLNQCTLYGYNAYSIIDSFAITAITEQYHPKQLFTLMFAPFVNQIKKETKKIKNIANC